MWSIGNCIINIEGDFMALCDKCHTAMSKEKLNFHKKGCVGEHTKGYDHFIECRSVWKLKKGIVGERRR